MLQERNLYEDALRFLLLEVFDFNNTLHDTRSPRDRNLERLWEREQGYQSFERPNQPFLAGAVSSLLPSALSVAAGPSKDV